MPNTDQFGNAVAGRGRLATTDVDGFAYIPVLDYSGVLLLWDPVPVYPGMAQVMWDRHAHTLYFYIGSSSWGGLVFSP